MPHTIELADDAATAALGRRLAAALWPGDVVLLQGPLGAGKTALARGAIRTLAGDERLDVPSPSFALVQPYDTPAGLVLHADLYRLTSEREIDELGLSDDAAAIVLVEWPERAPEWAAQATVTLTLGLPPEGGRRAVVTFADGRPF